MKGLNGFLIAVYSLAAMAMSLVIMGLAAPFPFLEGFRTSSLELFNNWVFALAAAAVFILSLWVFIANVLPADRVKTINRQGELGEYRISFDALESMVLQAARDIEGVQNARTRLSVSDAGLVIYVRIATLPDIKVPDLAGEIQKNVRNYVQDISGVDVAEVKVLVENISKEKRK
jgi:uncharacterized alkaline shock family protein YloU